jgi:hypothetical protein
MKIKEGLTISTFDFWYDLTDGGYLKPEKICANLHDAERVQEAREVILDFYESCVEQIDGFEQ